MTRYMRVKNKTTGHEFDLPVESFNEKKYTRVDEKRYPPTSRPRRPKPRRNAPKPVNTEKE